MEVVKVKDVLDIISITMDGKTFLPNTQIL